MRHKRPAHWSAAGQGPVSTWVWCTGAGRLALARLFLHGQQAEEGCLETDNAPDLDRLQITWKTRLRASADIKMNRWIYLMSYSSVHYHVHRSERISFASNLKKNSSLFKKILTVRTKRYT